MTLHKRGGAQSCLDYRHGVSSYCAGLNAPCRKPVSPVPGWRHDACSCPIAMQQSQCHTGTRTNTKSVVLETRRKAEARMHGSHYQCRLIACHQEKARAARRIHDVTARHRPVDIASIQ